MDSNELPRVEFLTFWYHWVVEPLTVFELAERFRCSLKEIDILRRKFGFERRDIDILADPSFQGLLNRVLFDFCIELTDAEYNSILDYVESYDFRGYDIILLTLWLYYAFFNLNCRIKVSLAEYKRYSREICYLAGHSYPKKNKLHLKALDDISKHFKKSCSPRNMRLKLFQDYCEAHPELMTPEVRRRGIHLIQEIINSGDPYTIVAGLIYNLADGRITQIELALEFRCSEVTIRNRAKEIKMLIKLKC